MTHRTEGGGECSSDERNGWGPLLQIGVQGVSAPRLTLAVQGGGEFERNGPALTGELGVSYRFGVNPAFGIHLGVVPELWFFNAALRYELLMDQGFVGGGIRVQPTYGAIGVCSVGRPLRTATGVALLGQPLRREDTRASDRLDERALRVGSAYARDAQLEYASVPAFLQLAAELSAHGAPAELVARALAAGRDEVGHARACADLASRHLRHRVTPHVYECVPRPPLPGRPGLVRLAVESWLDGCSMESVAAAQAGAAARVASDADVRLLQLAVAADEHNHAELAWAVLQFALARGGDEVREALLALRGVETVPVDAELEPDGFEADGRLGARARDAIADHERTRARTRLERMLRTA